MNLTHLVFFFYDGASVALGQGRAVELSAYKPGSYRGSVYRSGSQSGAIYGSGSQAGVLFHSGTKQSHVYQPGSVEGDVP